MGRHFRIPKVGERVSIEGASRFFGDNDNAGIRLEGFSDPGRKMAWVRFDDGRVRGIFLEDLVPASQSDKTLRGALESGAVTVQQTEVWRPLMNDLGHGENMRIYDDIEAKTKSEAMKRAEEKYGKGNVNEVIHAGTVSKFIKNTKLDKKIDNLL